MTIVKLYLLKSNFEQTYIYTNENYIKLNENNEILYYDQMKLLTCNFITNIKI